LPPFPSKFVAMVESDEETEEDDAAQKKQPKEEVETTGSRPPLQSFAPANHIDPPVPPRSPPPPHRYMIEKNRGVKGMIGSDTYTTRPTGHADETTPTRRRDEG